jgi:hypothetical protein
MVGLVAIDGAPRARPAGRPQWISVPGGPHTLKEGGAMTIDLYRTPLLTARELLRIGIM